MSPFEKAVTALNAAAGDTPDDQVRAVLAAIREPTCDTLDAGHGGRVNWDKTTLGAVFAEMIDHVIADDAPATPRLAD